MKPQPGACERLAQSRERLRQALLGADFPHPASHQRHSEPGAPDWLSGLKSSPGAGLLLGIFQAWWAKQPLRVAVLLAADAADVLLRPVAQHHPYRLVLGAAGAGALLVLARPWRWISVPALLAGLVPKLMSEVLVHLRKPADQVSRSADH